MYYNEAVLERQQRFREEVHHARKTFSRQKSETLCEFPLPLLEPLYMCRAVVV